MASNRNTLTRINAFWQKYKLRIILVFVLISFILILNSLLKMTKKDVPRIEKNPFAAIIKSEEKITPEIYTRVNSIVQDFATKCREGKYEEGYDMLSEDCKSNVITNIEEFKKYADTNFPKDSVVDVVLYSKAGNTHIYQVKVFDNFLHSGLSGTKPTYIDLKMAVKRDKDGKEKLNVAGYIDYADLDSVFENDYLKIALTKKKTFYLSEVYEYTITNRSEYDLVLRDNSKNKGHEIILKVGAEERPDNIPDNIIVLKPYETRKVVSAFTKFADDNINSSYVGFPAIRVCRGYDIEKQKAKETMAEFSIELPITK